MSNNDLIKKAKNLILHPNDEILVVIDDEKNWMKTRSLIKAIKNEYINTDIHKIINFVLPSFHFSLNFIYRGTNVIKI